MSTNGRDAICVLTHDADDAGLARVHAPIGLNIGARTPEETAASICAEIIAMHTGQRDVRPLGNTDGPIPERHSWQPVTQSVT